MNGTIIEVSTNKHGTYGKVRLKDPSDGMNQHFNIPGQYAVGDEVVVEVRVNTTLGAIGANRADAIINDAMAAADAVGVTRG